ncbi:hypothetical protein VP01_1676g1 [Puccinia sorghi]|uniref:Uncharacterized protein n=1 Tax=Puccinia sorghi TaxID=27349 RepID=A0A0L6VG07_9BASI|nr:hypothetical protein VP01_1676g1 [Puccinia sorghi]
MLIKHLFRSLHGRLARRSRNIRLTVSSHVDHYRFLFISFFLFPCYGVWRGLGSGCSEVVFIITQYNICFSLGAPSLLTFSLLMFLSCTVVYHLLVYFASLWDAHFFWGVHLSADFSLMLHCQSSLFFFFCIPFWIIKVKVEESLFLSHSHQKKKREKKPFVHVNCGERRLTMGGQATILVFANTNMGIDTPTTYSCIILVVRNITAAGIRHPSLSKGLFLENLLLLLPLARPITLHGSVPARYNLMSIHSRFLIVTRALPISYIASSRLSCFWPYCCYSSSWPTHMISFCHQQTHTASSRNHRKKRTKKIQRMRRPQLYVSLFCFVFNKYIFTFYLFPTSGDTDTSKKGRRNRILPVLIHAAHTPPGSCHRDEEEWTPWREKEQDGGQKTRFVIVVYVSCVCARGGGFISVDESEGWVHKGTRGGEIGRGSLLCCGAERKGRVGLRRDFWGPTFLPARRRCRKLDLSSSSLIFGAGGLQPSQRAETTTTTGQTGSWGIPTWWHDHDRRGRNPCGPISASAPAALGVVGRSFVAGWGEAILLVRAEEGVSSDLPSLLLVAESHQPGIYLLMTGVLLAAEYMTPSSLPQQNLSRVIKKASPVPKIRIFRYLFYWSSYRRKIRFVDPRSTQQARVQTNVAMDKV